MSPWETWEDLTMFLDCGKEDEHESECGRKSEREMTWEYRKKRHVMWRGGAWGIEDSVRRSHFREQEGKRLSGITKTLGKLLTDLLHHDVWAGKWSPEFTTIEWDEGVRRV